MGEVREFQYVEIDLDRVVDYYIKAIFDPKWEDVSDYYLDPVRRGLIYRSLRPLPKPAKAAKPPKV